MTNDAGHFAIQELVTRHVSLLYMGRNDPIAEGSSRGYKKQCNLFPWALTYVEQLPLFESSCKSESSVMNTDEYHWTECRSSERDDISVEKT